MKSSIKYVTLATLSSLCVPALALAADEHAAPQAIGGFKEGIASAVTALVVFAVVFAILAVKVWPAVSKGLDDRASKIRNSIEEAELAQEQAKAALEQYERNLAQARAEAQKMLDDAKNQQLVIAAELKTKAEAELVALREKAKRDIDSAKSQAVVEIHSQAAMLATAMAGKILKREVSAGDQQRLIQESLAELQTAGRA